MVLCSRMRVHGVGLTLLLQPLMLRTTIVVPCRRMVQVHVCTSDVHARLSQFAKRELHSLANYLLTSFSDQDVTLFTRHFVKVGPEVDLALHQALRS